LAVKSFWKKHSKLSPLSVYICVCVCVSVSVFSQIEFYCVFKCIEPIVYLILGNSLVCFRYETTLSKNC